MDTNHVYHINHLMTSYDGKHNVLEIEDIQIERGKIYFFIGASGVGKSTLLEILGLMNFPAQPGGHIRYMDGAGSETCLYDLWKRSDAHMAEFRRDNFSFIFQSTNLMPHFTAGENMMYTLLLEGFSITDAKAKVLKIMPHIRLDEVLFDRPIQQLSGGQRQRLAFVRAFVSSFEVLFGDEPTGNLDSATAADLMYILQEHIKEEHKTAVIVSHDVELAEKFADEIFYLKKRKNDAAILSPTQVYKKQDDIWYDYNGNQILEMNELLNRHLV